MTHLLRMTKFSTGNQPQTDPQTGNPGIEAQVNMLALINEERECRFSGEQVFSQGSVVVLILGLTYLRKPLVWSHILFLPSDALISIQPTFIPDIDILSLATCIHAIVIEIIHDHSLTHGPSAQWSTYTLTKSMLDSLRYLRSFLRRKDPAASPHLLHIFLSCISAWQPYTWTFVVAWRRAASLAAGKGRLFLLECRRRETIILWMQPTGLSDARRAGGQRILCAVQAFNLLWPIGFGHVNDRYCDAFVIFGLAPEELDVILRSHMASQERLRILRHSWLETSIIWKRSPQALDEGIPWRWYLASTTFPVPPAESGTMESVAFLERQQIVVHRKSSNFKNVQRLRTSKIACDGTNHKLSQIIMMHIDLKTVLEAINRYDGERNQTKFMCFP